MFRLKISDFVWYRSVLACEVSRRHRLNCEQNFQDVKCLLKWSIWRNEGITRCTKLNDGNADMRSGPLRRWRTLHGPVQLLEILENCLLYISSFDGFDSGVSVETQLSRLEKTSPATETLVKIVPFMERKRWICLPGFNLKAINRFVDKRILFSPMEIQSR